MILIPCVMLLLLRYVFDGSPRTFDSIGASLLGIFPLITMFLVTSIATLRERTSGTLERLLAMPLGKADLIVGYALAFGALAIVQSALATGLAVWALGLDVTGSAWLLLLVALLDALLGTALGLFVSAFASSEFQAVQFMPAVIFPQLLLCGLFTPRPNMHPVLEGISNVLPMSYAVDGMNEVLKHTDVTANFIRDALIVAACALARPELSARQPSAAAPRNTEYHPAPGTGPPSQATASRPADNAAHAPRPRCEDGRSDDAHTPEGNRT